MEEEVIKPEWEEVINTGRGWNSMFYEVTERMKVIGGWLVKYEHLYYGNILSTSICFLPDANHEWRIK